MVFATYVPELLLKNTACTNIFSVFATFFFVCRIIFKKMYYIYDKFIATLSINAFNTLIKCKIKKTMGTIFLMSGAEIQPQVNLTSI